MAFTAKVQRTIHAPAGKVWDGLTKPELVKQYFFGTDLVTDWKVGSPVYFRGEWEGKPYEDKGTVLRFEPGKLLEYDYLSSWSQVEDKPENYQQIIYSLKPKGDGTILTIIQKNIPGEESQKHSAKNWAGLLKALKALMEK